MSQYFHLRKMKMVMNPTVTKMDNWMTILKQMKMEALVLVAPFYSTRKQATDQTKVGASADLYIHVLQAYRQEEKFAHRNCISECSFDGQTSLPFPYFTKNIRPCKMCALCINKKKKFHPEGVNRQHINLSSVTLPCAVWGVFWNTTSSEMWRCKIRRVGYYMHTFIRNKMKKELSFCLF